MALIIQAIGLDYIPAQITGKSACDDAFSQKLDLPGTDNVMTQYTNLSIFNYMIQ